jgi:hypothetical protein
MARPTVPIRLTTEPAARGPDDVINALAALLALLARADARRASAQAVEVHTHNLKAHAEGAEHTK